MPLNCIRIIIDFACVFSDTLIRGTRRKAQSPTMRKQWYLKTNNSQTLANILRCTAYMYLLNCELFCIQNYKIEYIRFEITIYNRGAQPVSLETQCLFARCLVSLCLLFTLLLVFLSVLLKSTAV